MQILFNSPVSIIEKIIPKFLSNKKITLNQNQNKKLNHEIFCFDRPIKNLTNRTLIMFVGGITYDELNELNKLHKMFPKKELHFATTSIITGRDLIESLF